MKGKILKKHLYEVFKYVHADVSEKDLEFLLALFGIQTDLHDYLDYNKFRRKLSEKADELKIKDKVVLEAQSDANYK